MSKLVLILNCGSSSLKFAVMDAETGEDMLSGLAECFNLDDARIKWKLHGVKGDAMLGAGAAHQEALDHIVGHILPQDPALADQLVAIGHRIVHGGEQFSRSVHLRYARISPRKVSIVMDLIRNKPLDEALAILQYTPKAACEPLLKLVKSAAANAENNFNMDKNNLYVAECYVCPGPTLKRMMPRAQGRGYRILKRTSHMTVVLKEKE